MIDHNQCWDNYDWVAMLGSINQNNGQIAKTFDDPGSTALLFNVSQGRTAVIHSLIRIKHGTPYTSRGFIMGNRVQGSDEYSIGWNQPNTILSGNIITDCYTYAFLNVDIGGNPYYLRSILEYNTMVGCSAYRINPDEISTPWIDTVLTAFQRHAG